MHEKQVKDSYQSTLKNSRSSICLSPGHKEETSCQAFVLEFEWNRSLLHKAVGILMREIPGITQPQLCAVQCIKFAGRMKQSTNIGYYSYRPSKHLCQHCLLPPHSLKTHNKNKHRSKKNSFLKIFCCLTRHHKSL